MAILVIIFLCISCTDNAELPVKPDKNEGTENVLIELAVTVPAVTYTRTRGIVRTIDHETLIMRFKYWYLRRVNINIVCRGCLSTTLLLP